MIIDGEKYACEPCVRGHRVSSCTHSDRKLLHVAKKARPRTMPLHRYFCDTCGIFFYSADDFEVHMAMHDHSDGDGKRNAGAGRARYSTIDVINSSAESSAIKNGPNRPKGSEYQDHETLVRRDKAEDDLLRYGKQEDISSISRYAHLPAGYPSSTPQSSGEPSKRVPSLTDGSSHLTSTIETTNSSIGDLDLPTAFGLLPDKLAKNDPNIDANANHWDVQSLLSIDDDIRSMQSDYTTSNSQTAEALLSYRMVQQAPFKELCDEASKCMPAERLVSNLRRLLKRYYLDLCQYAHTTLEKESARILRTRGARVRIAQWIVERTRTVQDGSHTHTTEADKIIQAGGIELERWIQSVRAIPDACSQDIMVLPELASDSEDDGHEASEIFNVPSIEQLEQFLIQGEPFHLLMINLSQFLRHPSSPDFLRVLMSIPTCDIQFITIFRPSVLDIMKSKMEDITSDSWNWWPLQQPERPILSGMVRVSWICHCGDRMWQDVTESEARYYEKMIKLRGDFATKDHLCLQMRRMKSPGLRSKATQSTGSSATSGSNSQMTGAANSQSAGVSSHGSIANPPSTTSNTVLIGPAATSGHSNHHNIQVQAQQTAYALLGVDNNGSMQMQHLDAVQLGTDGAFFSALKAKHDMMRGCVKRWTSIWYFSHCDFVKFEKWRANEVRSAGTDLPTHLEYIYSPRPPAAQPPVISVHEFEKSLYPCFLDCKSRWLPFSHRCLFPSDEDTAIARTPKKTSEWLIKSKGTDYAWGMEARYRPSALRVLLYHVLILTPCFVFLALWIIGTKEDLQGASVPMTMVLGMLSLFWSLFGVWKTPEKLTR